MQLEHRETVRLIRYRFLDLSRMLVKRLLTTGDDLRDNREAVAGRSLGKIGPYLPCSTLSLEYPPLGIAMAAGLVQSPCWVSDIAASFFLLSDIAQSVGSSTAFAS